MSNLKPTKSKFENSCKPRQTSIHRLENRSIVFARMLIFAAVAILFSINSSKADETKKQLFILSGQSNMTGGLKTGFTQRVEAEFGKENVTIAYHCKSGRGIRFWDKDYRFPNDYEFPGKGAPSERTKKQHGQVYGPMMKKVKDACNGKSHDTITFIWMQGESDGSRGLGDVYEESFLRLLNRIKNDLNRKDISFVIGRINNARLNGPSSNLWKRVRDVQVNLAKDAVDGDWIDTDDLSRPDAGVHFPANNYPKLGSRFAEKAIVLIQKRAARAEKETQGVNSK